MISYDEILKIAPYSLNKEEKNVLLTTRLQELTLHHRKHCIQYDRIVKMLGFDIDNISDYTDLPFLPVRLFKEMDLLSVPRDEIVKTMTSSGTTGQRVSRIYLDRATSGNQQKTLVKIVSDYTGQGRMPMLIIDSPSVISNRAMFSARGAGILGFSIFARDKEFALDDNMRLNMEAIDRFIEKHRGKNILLFGFTFMIWQHFYKELKKQNKKLAIENGIMIHGGGWKKLSDEAVSPSEYNHSIEEVCGVSRVYDYYGMVEQTGSIYMQCEQGHFHASIFSDVIVRSTEDFKVLNYGEEGILQVVSLLPESYPGHSILTEDKGIILGEDDCPCGRKGKYFVLRGRLQNAEVRGCSDTYERK